MFKLPQATASPTLPFLFQGLFPRGSVSPPASSLNSSFGGHPGSCLPKQWPPREDAPGLQWWARCSLTGIWSERSVPWAPHILSAGGSLTAAIQKTSSPGAGASVSPLLCPHALHWCLAQGRCPCAWNEFRRKCSVQRWAMAQPREEKPCPPSKACIS